MANTGARWSLTMPSAVSVRGKLRFMLIVGGLPCCRRATATKEFGQSAKDPENPKHLSKFWRPRFTRSATAPWTCSHLRIHTMSPLETCSAELLNDRTANGSVPSSDSVVECGPLAGALACRFSRHPPPRLKALELPTVQPRGGERRRAGACTPAARQAKTLH